MAKINVSIEQNPGYGMLKYYAPVGQLVESADLESVQ